MLDLSLEQKAAVHYVKGPLLVLAGAGHGKTSLLVRKIAWLLQDFDVDPAALLVLAVNANSARAIRTAARELLCRNVPGLAVDTFHAFALRALRHRPQAVGLRPGFSLYDRTESETVVARLLHEHWPDTPLAAGDVWACIARWKADLIEPPVVECAAGPLIDMARRLYPLYQQRLRLANAVDVMDLSPLAARVLGGEVPDPGLRFVLIDEYEQAGGGEHALVRQLVAAGAVLTAVADDVLGQDAAGLARLRSDFPAMRVLRLEQNHRASRRIRSAVAALLDPATGARRSAPVGTNLSGVPVRLLQVRSEQHEADDVVRALLDHKVHHAASFRDYAILYRRAEQAARLERALQAQRIPYQVAAGRSAYDQPEVRDFWAYLKLLSNPADDDAFLRAIRTPRRDIERATIEALMRFAAERARPLLASALDPELAQRLCEAQHAALRDVAALLHEMSERATSAKPVQLAYDLLAQLRYEEWLRDTCNDFNIAAQRMDNVMQVIGTLDRLAQRHPDADLGALLAQFALGAVPDPDLAAEGVALIEIDNARGMEFAHVYVAGFEDCTSGASADTEPTAAEQRLAYVALTRARDSITFATVEAREAGARPPRALRFLSGLAPADLEWAHAGPGGAFATGQLAMATGRLENTRRYPR